MVIPVTRGHINSTLPAWDLIRTNTPFQYIRPEVFMVLIRMTVLLKTVPRELWFMVGLRLMAMIRPRRKLQISRPVYLNMEMGKYLNLKPGEDTPIGNQVQIFQ